MSGWIKKGLLIRPPADAPWRLTHAALPVIHPLGGDRYRVYFSCRDAQNRARVSYAELALTPPYRVERFSNAPCLDLGELGAFDDNGITLSCLVDRGDELHLFYTGWNKGVEFKFQLLSGLAISTDGGETFRRYSRAPILERIDREPFLNASPFVLRDGGRWRMWYVSGEGWLHADVPRYNIKYAESTDGLHWARSGRVCIDFAGADEHAIARPWVRKEGKRYRMWFAARGKAYRIGYAESDDGLSWRRNDSQAGIDPTPGEWDSDMVEYPCVFEHAGRLHLLYNGNDYGRDGIGLAVAGS